MLKEYLKREPLLFTVCRTEVARVDMDGTYWLANDDEPTRSQVSHKEFCQWLYNHYGKDIQYLSPKEQELYYDIMGNYINEFEK